VDHRHFGYNTKSTRKTPSETKTRDKLKKGRGFSQFYDIEKLAKKIPIKK
jgi:hypothetical protein